MEALNGAPDRVVTRLHTATPVDNVDSPDTKATHTLIFRKDLPGRDA